MLNGDLKSYSDFSNLGDIFTEFLPNKTLLQIVYINSHFLQKLVPKLLENAN